jgi:hypothetical protein
MKVTHKGLVMTVHSCTMAGARQVRALALGGGISARGASFAYTHHPARTQQPLAAS